MIQWRSKWRNEKMKWLQKLLDWSEGTTKMSLIISLFNSSLRFHLWTSLHPNFNLILHLLIQQMLTEHLQWWNQTWCYLLRRDQWIREVSLLRSSYLKSSFDEWTRNYITLQMPMRLCKVLESLRCYPSWWNPASIKVREVKRDWAGEHFDPYKDKTLFLLTRPSSCKSELNSGIFNRIGPKKTWIAPNVLCLLKIHKLRY